MVVFHLWLIVYLLAEMKIDKWFKWEICSLTVSQLILIKSFNTVVINITGVEYPVPHKTIFSIHLQYA